MVSLGSDAKREVEDMHLSRYACYLVVQNARAQILYGYLPDKANEQATANRR
jgi:hypothetical protein